MLRGVDYYYVKATFILCKLNFPKGICQLMEVYFLYKISLMHIAVQHYINKRKDLMIRGKLGMLFLLSLRVCNVYKWIFKQDDKMT